MSTQVMIARQSPTQVPMLRYNLLPTPAPTPAAGVLSVDPNQEAATRIYASKTDADGVDATIWLGYLNRHSTSSTNRSATTPSTRRSSTRPAATT